MTATNIVLLGPPGSGKGTQGELLEQTLHLPRLSVGALIRRNVENKTPEGIIAEQYMVKGLAIPADIYISIVGSWLIEHTEGFVVDNLIRTKEQLDAYSAFQAQHPIILTKVFCLRISEDEAKRRLLVRKFVKIRPDETPESLHQRFIVFQTHIPIISKYFMNLGIYEEVDARGSVEHVSSDIIRRLQKRFPGCAKAEKSWVRFCNDYLLNQ
jgi:adenylate kinase